MKSFVISKMRNEPQQSKRGFFIAIVFTLLFLIQMGVSCSQISSAESWFSLIALTIGTVVPLCGAGLGMAWLIYSTRSRDIIDKALKMAFAGGLITFVAFVFLTSIPVVILACTSGHRYLSEEVMQKVVYLEFGVGILAGIKVFSWAMKAAKN